MRRVRAGMVAGLGLFAGPAFADDIGWKAVTPVTPPIAVTPAPSSPTFIPNPPVETTIHVVPAADPVWQAARLRAPVAAPSEPTIIPVSDGPIFRPVEVPSIPLPTQMPARVQEPLPVPRPLPGGPTEVAPRPTLLTPNATVNPMSAQIWGTGPIPAQLPCEGTDGTGAPVEFTRPVRKAGGGSPNLMLTRDHHFLDLFGVGVFADEAGGQIVGETLATDRYFVSAEYLLWWVNPGNIPVLASTSNNGNFGFLGQPGTSNLLGPGQFGPGLRDGFRVRAGAWLDDCMTCGIDGSFFFLGNRGESFTVNSDQFSTITRPFFAPNFNTEFGELVAFPGLSTGTLIVDTDSQLWGADVNFRKSVCRTCESRSEWFAGFRYLNLAENLRITELISAVATTTFPAGTQIVVQDSFSVRNQFYGGQIGWAVGRTRGRWDFDARLSVALGVTHQTLDINGFQAVTPPGQPQQNFVGGLLAAGPNIGSFSKNQFSVVPEMTLTAGYRVTPNFRVTGGFNFLYWSNVIRPGDQIDRVVDLTFVPNSLNVPFSGQNRPQPTFKQSDLFVPGIQFGVEYRW